MNDGQKDGVIKNHISIKETDDFEAGRLKIAPFEVGSSELLHGHQRSCSRQPFFCSPENQVLREPGQL
uniref:Uncharacterized protein n=1 Tax=Anguilla anguilla TaxID=7936 RepID=A0A0E9PAK1_ANGAN